MVFIVSHIFLERTQTLLQFVHFSAHFGISSSVFHITIQRNLVITNLNIMKYIQRFSDFPESFLTESF